MARKSQWAGNVEMWEWAASLRRGGVFYADIHARLNLGENRRRFGLLAVPSEDTLRYHAKKHGSLSDRRITALAPDDLAEHVRALTYLAVLLREGLVDPPHYDFSFAPIPLGEGVPRLLVDGYL